MEMFWNYKNLHIVEKISHSSRKEGYHYKNMPIQIYWNFYHKKKKNWKFSDKILKFFIFLLKTYIVGTC